MASRKKQITELLDFMQILYAKGLLEEEGEQFIKGNKFCGCQLSRVSYQEYLDTSIEAQHREGIIEKIRQRKLEEARQEEQQDIQQSKKKSFFSLFR